MRKEKLVKVFLFYCSFVVIWSQKESNNACETFLDYVTFGTNKNCFYNPDMRLEAPQLIKKYTGKLKTYQAVTQDGYILRMFRIYKRHPKGVVFLNHPLVADSRIWVSSGFNNSLGFYLWNAGYDVWLNNNRGTLFSQRHNTLTVKNHSYWDFSFHEVGNYDIPAEIAVIQKHTNNSKIIYIGHSVSSTSGLIYGSLHSEDAKNFVKMFIFMATPAYFKYATSALRLFIPYESLSQSYIKGVGNPEVVPSIKEITRVAFRMQPLLLLLVNVILSLFIGGPLEETDPTLMNLAVGIAVKAFSYKTLMHYLQLLKAQDKFQMYDYGAEENLKRYNSETPPLYPIDKFSVPVILISSTDDSLFTQKDSNLLVQNMPENIVKDHLKLNGLNPMHYFLGKHQKAKYFDQILEYVNKAYNKT